MNQEVEMKLDRSSASQSPLRRLMTLAAIAGIGAATITLAGVVNATPATVNSIILLVGADESQRVVNWYASANTSQLVQIAPTEELPREWRKLYRCFQPWPPFRWFLGSVRIQAQ